MSKDTRKYSSVLSLLGTILSIAALSLVVLQIYLPGTIFPEDTIEIQVLVVGGNTTGEGIPGAEVSLELAGKAPIISTTDQRGFATFTVPSEFKDLPGRVVIDAPGYKTYMTTIGSLDDLTSIINLVQIKD